MMLFIELPSWPSLKVWWALLVTGVIATAAGFFVQTLVQQRLSAVQTAIIAITIQHHSPGERRKKAATSITRIDAVAWSQALCWDLTIRMMPWMAYLKLFILPAMEKRSEEGL